MFGLPAPPTWLVLPVLFLGAAWVMACIARGVAELFERFEPLEAYRLDIAGSLLGIVAFSALSFLSAGPLVWGVVLGVCFLGLAPTTAYAGGRVAVAAAVVVLGLGSLASADVWSPYYRVSVYAERDGRIPIRVNSLPHQSMLALAEIEAAFYSKPYSHLERPPGSVLIVGAGNGNDVALALDRGRRPRGRRGDRSARCSRPAASCTRRIPTRTRASTSAHRRRARVPGAQRRARTTSSCSRLPDSLTLVSGQGSLRLESYLFTTEAMASVREQLGPGRRLRDVQLLPRRRVRPLRGHHARGLRPRPVLRRRCARVSGPRQQSVLTIGREPGGHHVHDPVEAGGRGRPSPPPTTGRSRT